MRNTGSQALLYTACPLLTFDPSPGACSSVCSYLVRAGTSSLFPSLLTDQALKLIDCVPRVRVSPLNRERPLTLQTFLFHLSHRWLQGSLLVGTVCEVHHNIFLSLKNRLSYPRTHAAESKPPLLGETCPNHRDAHARHLAAVDLRDRSEKRDAATPPLCTSCGSADHTSQIRWLRFNNVSKKTLTCPLGHLRSLC